VKKLVKNSVIYLGTEILNKAIPFLLIPIITRYLTPTEYGFYGIYQVLLSFLAPFISMNLQNNITRNFFKVSHEKLSKIISSVILILHINVFVGFVVIYLISLVFQNPFGINQQFLYIMPIIIYSQMINSFNLTILRNKEKAFEYGVVQITITIINFSATLLLLISYHQGWESLIYSLLLGNVVVMVYSFYSLYSEYKLGFYFSSISEILKISIPLVFHLLGGSIIFLSDRVFIQYLEGLKEVGIYSIGSQFGMITMIVINAIIMAISPWIYKQLSNNINIYKKLYIFMGLFVVLGIVLWLASLAIIPYMVDQRYILATDLIFWISLAFIFRGWYQLFFNVIVHYGKTGIFIYITFGSAILNMILNYYLIKLNGMVGAAQATAVAFFMMFISTKIYLTRIKQGIT